MCPTPSIQTTDDHSTSVEVIEKSRDLTGKQMERRLAGNDGSLS